MFKKKFNLFAKSDKAISSPMDLHDHTYVTEVYQFLYLSGQITKQKIQKEKFTAVISVINQQVETPRNVEHLKIEQDDDSNASLRPSFEKAFQVIERHRSKRGGKVLIHCLAGISRSPTVVLAYMIRHMNMSLRDAFLLLRQKRPIIFPNNKFLQELIDYEKDIHGKQSVDWIYPDKKNLPDFKILDVLNESIPETSPKL